jgi:hypothetical protein
MSNEELREQIKALSGQLGVEVPANLKDMKNPVLLEQHAELQAKLSAQPAPEAAAAPEPVPKLEPASSAPEALTEVHTDASELQAAMQASPTGVIPAEPKVPPVLDGATGELAAPTAPAKVARKFAYEVAPGASISCGRGILGPGEEVIPEKDVPSAEDLARFIEIGVVLGPEAKPVEAPAT